MLAFLRRGQKHPAISEIEPEALPETREYTLDEIAAMGMAEFETLRTSLMDAVKQQYEQRADLSANSATAD